MGVKVTTKKNNFPKMEISLKSLNGKKVNVGVLGGGENAWLAGIHEYGCNIPVTEKMRKYLHSQGLHLKPTTTEIHIPERSFLRTGHDTHIDEVLENAERLLPLVLSGELPVDDYLGSTLGEMLKDAIADYATELSTPGNHPFTISRKGRNDPLDDCGDMIAAIDYEVE